MGDRAERQEEMGGREAEGERMEEKEKRQEWKGVEVTEQERERQNVNGEVGDNEANKGGEDKGKGNTERNKEEREGEVQTGENGVPRERERDAGAETQEEPVVHNLAGEWELDRSENYDEFLKAIGMNVVARRIATQTTSVTIDIDQTADQFVIRTLAGPFYPVQKFTVGETCHIQEPDGTKVKLCPRWTSKSLKVECTPVASGSKQTKAYTITRQPTLDDRLITKLQAGNVVCKRVFKKVRKR